MDLEIYEAKEKKKEPVRLKLIDYGDSISVIAVGRWGNKVRSGNLIKFCTDGKAGLYRGVNSELGFDLDINGKLKLT